MHVAAVQLDIVWEDKAANHRIIEDMLAAARPPAGSYVLLPELTDTGFSFDLDVIVDERTMPWAAALAQRLGVWIQVGHAVRGDDGRGRNCASIVSPQGECLGTYEKVHPFAYAGETEHFSGGDRLILRRCDGAVVCPLICYDLRFPELWRLAALAGAEVFPIGASWPDARQAHWRALLIARAIENQAFVIGANRVGADPRSRYVGGSMIVSPEGRVIAEASSDPAIITAELDLPALRDWRQSFPVQHDVRRSLLGSVPVDGRISDHDDLQEPKRSLRMRSTR